MPIINDLRDTQLGTAGPINSGLLLPKQEDVAPVMLDTLAAAARQTNVAAALTARIMQPDPDLPDAPAGWEPLDHIQGYEEYANRLSTAASPSELAGRKQRIQAEIADKQLLAKAGMTGTAASLFFGLVDPSFLVAAAVPEVAAARGVRLAKTLSALGQGVTGAALYEGELQSLQETRTLKESALNIGAGALLSAALGSVARNVPKAELDAAQRNIDMQSSTVGAASVIKPTTLEAESIAGAGGGVSSLQSKLPLIATDLDKVMTSESAAARVALQELADVPAVLNKNLEGIASPTSVEAMTEKHLAAVADFSDSLDSGWTAYRARVPAAERMSRDDFLTSVASASRRNDQHLVPEVQALARRLRSTIFDPLWNAATKLGLSGKVESVVGAASYFTRMYDREAIRANLTEWQNTLISHFSKTNATRAEVLAAVDDVTAKILHADVGQSNFATQVTVPAAGPLKERMLDIPDELIERFLVNDPLKVARSYVQEVAPQVEMAKRFGDKEMTQQLQNIADEYALRRRALSDSPTKNTTQQLKALLDQEKSVKEAIIRVRDRVLGRAGRLSANAGEGERRAVMASRAFRNYVASTKLGGTALTGGLMDTARIAASYGFLPTIKKISQFVASPEFRALSKSQARRVGSMVEVALSRRLNIAADGAITEGWSQKLAESVYKYTGLSHTTDFNRMLAASLFEDSALKAAEKVAAGEGLSKYTIGFLASRGLGTDELRRVAEEVSKHGGETGGARVSGSADWTDKALSDIYDAAILKESKIVVQQPGAADRVWWMDKETGKFLGQLKTFSLSSTNRLLTPGLQMIAGGPEGIARFARFAGFMMMGGYLTHALRQTIAGKIPETNPGRAANEAFTESGLGGVLPDILSPIGRRFGLGESVKYADRNVFSAYGGPAVGSFVDLYDIAMNRTQGGLSASDLHALRRAIPFNNVWWLRREINALEGETAEAANLKGYDTATLGQRLMRTDALKPAGQRGGTGTGLMQ